MISSKYYSKWFKENSAREIFGKDEGQLERVCMRLVITRLNHTNKNLLDIETTAAQVRLDFLEVMRFWKTLSLLIPKSLNLRSVTESKVYQIPMQIILPAWK